MGVRMALGASPEQVVASAGKIVAIGIATGLAPTVALHPALRSMVFGVSPLYWMSLRARAE